MEGWQEARKAFTNTPTHLLTLLRFHVSAPLAAFEWTAGLTSPTGLHQDDVNAVSQLQGYCHFNWML